MKTILDRFWGDFGDQNGALGRPLGAPKSSLSASREALDALKRSWIDFGGIWASKLEAKIYPKREKKQFEIGARFTRALKQQKLILNEALMKIEDLYSFRHVTTASQRC